MAIYTGSFTNKGLSQKSDFSPVRGDLTYTISGTFVGKVFIDKSLSSGGFSWLPFVGPFTGPATGNLPVPGDCVFRVRVAAYTSGTISYTYTTPVPVSALPDFTNLPTTLPTNAGILWNNGGMICVS